MYYVLSEHVLAYARLFISVDRSAREQSCYKNDL